MEFQFLVSKSQERSYFPVDLLIFRRADAFVLENLFETSHRRHEGRRVGEGSNRFLFLQNEGFQLACFDIGNHPELAGDFLAQPVLRLRVSQD